MRYLKFVILFLILPLFAFSAHKYYVSLCEIEHVEEQQSVQIILGMFIDDLEVTLNKEHQATLNLATKNEVKNIDKFYKTYLKKHFKIKINTLDKDYIFLGKEYDADIVRFYLEIPDIQKINAIEITNNSLFEYFEEQQNIIKIKVNKLNKTFYLNKKNNQGLLNFQ